MHYLRILSFLAGIALLAACSSDQPNSTFSIFVDENHFSPHRIEVMAGKPTTLFFYNLRGNEEHQFAIQEIPIAVQGKADPLAGHNMAGMGVTEMTGDPPQLHVVAPVGKQAQLSFTPTKPGEYPFQCILPGHIEKGVLIVQ